MTFAPTRREFRSIPYAHVDAIVVGLHLRWRGVWQRPNHILSRLAADTPVIVLEEPVIDGGLEDAIARWGGITVVTPHRTAAFDALDDRALSTVRSLVGSRTPLVWLYTPMMAALADAFAGAPLVFDKMDELANFAFADPRIIAREREVLDRADVVFAGGRSLFHTVERRTRNPHRFPSGVDVEHFAAARALAPHPALAVAGGGPVFGYIGVIDERLDLPLIDALAAANPNATIAMVGPVVKIDPATLPRRANIAYLGAREYDELPALLAGFDVALMPFGINAHTHNISPTKTLEYLAAGRPVVSTAVPDVVADHGDVVYIAHGPAEFIAAVERARTPDPARAALAARRVAGSSWNAIVAAMCDELASSGITLAAPPLRTASGR
jgi:glycosyltransferase involved in cell wall biosynthesis